MRTMWSTPLVGRTAELARLERAATAAAAGRSTVVALVGAHGLGKTTLLDRAQDVGVARGATVLATQGRAADAELPFAALVTLLRPVEARLDELAGDLAPELRAALALGRRPADPVAVQVATLRVLGAVAAEGPLLVLVDDAHLVDRASADVLAFAAGRFYAEAVLVVIATEQYTPTAFDDLGPETIALDELDDDEITEILDAAVPLAPEPQRRCVELAEGNPLAALELAASLDAGQRSGTVPLPVIPRLNGVVGNAFALRFERVSQASRNALAVAAADDTGEVAVVVAALDRLGEPGGGLAEAEAAGLATTAGGIVRFTHPLLRPAAYHQIGVAARRMAHAALAAVLDAPHHGASRAWQQVAAAARPDAAAASALARDAADMARRGGTGAAARTFECAAALAPAVAQCRDHLVAATWAWLDAGERRAAARVADRLAALPPTAGSVAVIASALRGTRSAAQVLAYVTAAERAVDPTDRPAVAAVLADELLAAGALTEAIARATPLATIPDAPGHLARAVLATTGALAPPDHDLGRSAPSPAASPPDPRWRPGFPAGPAEPAAGAVSPTDPGWAGDGIGAGRSGAAGTGSSGAPGFAVSPTGVASAADPLAGRGGAGSGLSDVAGLAEPAVSPVDLGRGRSGVGAGPSGADGFAESAAGVVGAAAAPGAVSPGDPGWGRGAVGGEATAGAGLSTEPEPARSPAGVSWAVGLVQTAAGAASPTESPLVGVGAGGGPGGGAVADRALVLGTAAAVDAGLRPGGASATNGPLVAVGGVSLDIAVARALAALHAGEVADAHDQLQRLDALGRAGAGAPFGRTGLAVALAEAELLVGRAPAAAERAAAVAQQAEALGLGWLRSRAEWTLGRIALAAGDDERALAHLHEACRLIPHLAAADLVAAAAGADRRAEADRCAALVRRFVGDRRPMLDVRARRAVGSGTGGGAHAGARQLDRALLRAEVAGLPLEAAAVAMARAERAWRSGDVDAARAGARDAARRWAACGVSCWTPRLARLQQHDPAPTAPALPAGLSPAEQRVAVTVAEGRTNQEAAETLFLSVKTIDFHLQNIYRKLGLRSRTELAVVVHHGTVPVPVAS